MWQLLLAFVVWLFATRKWQDYAALTKPKQKAQK